MPRRNSNANAIRINRAALADHARDLATDIDPLARCAACRVNPATCGDYCALCKGVITVSARRTVLARR